ncbi:MAG: hypothetical protein EPO32_00150 [Anaerolineae bacterium]|nr:MAG: hypothetical protein EPO32_00150 [Anaerolineae bacterium]
MTSPEFLDFRNRVFDYHHRGEFRAALEAVTTSQSRFLDELNTLIFWQACFHALLGEKQPALETLNRGLASGEWWHPAMLRNDSDLASLQEVPEFLAILNVCQRRHEGAQESGSPELLEILPQTGHPPYPCLLALHGMGSRAAFEAANWGPASQLGWLVAVPQSSRLLSPRRYHWPDVALAHIELSHHLQDLSRRGAILPSQCVLAGFSQGGALALQFALHQSIPCRGVIGVVPGRVPLDELETAATASGQAGLRAYLIVGGQDRRREDFEILHTWLEQHGIPCLIEWHPEIGHAFPTDMSSSLRAALDFVMNTSTNGEIQ